MTFDLVASTAGGLTLFLALRSLWRSPSPQVRNALFLVAFTGIYGWIDWRGVPVLLGSAAADFGIALALERNRGPTASRALLGLSLLVNLGLLVGLKYLGFLESVLAWFGGLLGLSLSSHTLMLFVPIGLSFFTLQRLTYTIDVYRGQMRACRDPLVFAAWASFLPIVPAGPIERARRLIPQFTRVRPQDPQEIVWSLQRILTGLFRKIVIADNLAPFVDQVFSQAPGLPASELAVGVFLFSVQIYCDFAGYSDLAIGVSRLLGFKVMENFNHPYIARDIAEFWHRWHISLSHWFRDYVFTPMTWKLSLARRTARMGAILVTFALSGLWHGVGANFIAWGLLHGAFFVPVIFGWIPPPATGKQGRGFAGSTDGGDQGLRIRDLPRVALTFAAVTLAWIPFRATSLESALQYFKGLLGNSWLVLPRGKTLLLLAGTYLAVDLYLGWRRGSTGKAHGDGGRAKGERLEDWNALPGPVRWALYAVMALAVLLFGQWGETQFIYMGF